MGIQISDIHGHEIVDNEEKKEYIDEEEDIEDDDLQEVCVTGGDKRIEIYETKHKNDAIVQCIGHLRITYHHSIGGGYAIGTGTIFHVEGNKCFIITCAHNIRTKIYHCVKDKCKGKMLYRKNCNKCGSVVVKKKELFKAVGVEFVRRGITKATFGDHEDGYDCDMDECLINDDEYSKYPHIKSGYDIAILVINDKKAAAYYKNKCKNIFLVNDFNLFINDKRQMNLFGYPGDKNTGKQMWGMSTPKTNEFTCGFNVKNEQMYLVNEQIDTFQGQSGASIYCSGDEEDIFWIISIHNGGSIKAGQNYGTLLDCYTLKWIHEYFDSFNIKIEHKIIQNETRQSVIYQQLKSKINKWKEQVIVNKNVNNKLKDENDKLQEKYLNVNQENEEFEKELSKVKQQNNELRTAVELYKDERKKLKFQINDNKDAIICITDSLDSANNIKIKLQETVKTQAAEMLMLKQQITDEQIEKKEITQKFKDANAKLSFQNKQIIQLTKQRDKYKQMYEAVMAEYYHPEQMIEMEVDDRDNPLFAHSGEYITIVSGKLLFTQKHQEWSCCEKKAEDAQGCEKLYLKKTVLQYPCCKKTKDKIIDIKEKGYDYYDIEFHKGCTKNETVDDMKLPNDEKYQHQELLDTKDQISQQKQTEQKQPKKNDKEKQKIDSLNDENSDVDQTQRKYKQPWDIEDVEQIVSIHFGAYHYEAAFCPPGAPSYQRMVDPNYFSTRSSTKLEENLTALLIDKETTDTFAMGYEAKELYTRAQEKKEDDKYMYFEHFNAYLYSRDHVENNIQISSADGKSTLPLSDLITKLVQEIMKQTLTQINGFNTLAGMNPITQKQVFWVLTVPTILDEMSKEFMKQCARGAGMIHFELGSEAIASVFHMLNAQGKDFRLQKHEKVIVLDCGRGTIDASCISMTSSFDSLELHFGDSIRANESQIVKEFMKLLCKLLPSDIIDSVKTNQTGQWKRQKQEFILAKNQCPGDLYTRWNVPFCFHIYSLLSKKRRKNKKNKEHTKIKQHIGNYKITDCIKWNTKQLNDMDTHDLICWQRSIAKQYENISQFGVETLIHIIWDNQLIGMQLQKNEIDQETLQKWFAIWNDKCDKFDDGKYSKSTIISNDIKETVIDVFFEEVQTLQELSKQLHIGTEKKNDVETKEEENMGKHVEQIAGSFKLGRSNLKIDRNGWLYLHEKVFVKIINFMRELFSNPMQNGCVKIIMVGSFANSKYLMPRLSKEFQNKTFFTAREPQLAVVKGALYWICQRGQ